MSKNPKGCYSLESAIKSERLPPAIRGRASGLLKRWEREKLPLADPSVRDWIAQVLGYFKGCYSGQDKTGNQSWNCSDLRIDPKADPVLNTDIHAGVHCIREYYPEFMPTAEDFAQAYWGQKPSIPRLAPCVHEGPLRWMVNNKRKANMSEQTKAGEYRALSAREAKERGYGSESYWEYLEASAKEHAAKGIKDAFTRSLADCLRGNNGD